MENAFEKIRESVPLSDFVNGNLAAARERGKYVCPYCGSGGHGTRTSDAAFSIMPDGRRFKCFSCGNTGDVFDLAAQVFGLSEDDKMAQLQAVADWAGLEIRPSGVNESAHKPRKQQTQANTRIEQKKPAERLSEPQTDYEAGRTNEAAKIEEWRRNIGDPAAAAYLSGRGYTVEQARAFGWGYRPGWIVIPFPGNDWYHIDRDITGHAPHKCDKPDTREVGPQPLWNPSAIDMECFAVTEGPFDAAAVESAGVPAVALCGIGYRDLIEAIGSKEGRKPVTIIALDRDETGQRTAARMAEDMAALNLPYRLMEWPDGVAGKDPDEISRSMGAERFADLMQGVAADTIESAKEARLKAFGIKDAARVAADVMAGHGAAGCIRTGFDSLDRVTGGGLPIGLTIMGAQSSMGKSTFAMQLACQIAKERPVLYVTIEQSAAELAAMSISRYTWQRDGGEGFASTAAEIYRPHLQAGWSDEHMRSVCDAQRDFSSDVGGRLHIMEPNGQPAVSEIGTAAAAIEIEDGTAPVVIVDYLQLIAPADPHDTDKRAIDRAVMELRQLSRDMHTAVYAISSLNRGSYYGGTVRLDSFKESGAIEYGADLLLALQPAGVEDEVSGQDDRARAKAAKIMREHKGSALRNCEVRVLKNRMGATPADGLPFTLHAAYSCFTEGNEINSRYAARTAYNTV